jgi:hypothetical protein
VFLTVGLFHPSVLSSGKASLPFDQFPISVSGRIGSSLACKYPTRVERTDSTKHSSFLLKESTKSFIVLVQYFEIK